MNWPLGVTTDKRVASTRDTERSLNAGARWALQDCFLQIWNGGDKSLAYRWWLRSATADRLEWVDVNGGQVLRYRRLP